MMKDTKGLRFAPLIRVSTETQEEKGRSLLNQRENLTHFIEQLGGQVIEWYAGQEHATPDQERKIFDQLLKDAKAGQFDAVMVDDFSRWSRDTYRHADAFQIFKKGGICLYVQARRYDPNDPRDKHYITVRVADAELSSAERLRKTMETKLRRAQEDHAPTSGNRPHGRAYDYATKKWVIGVNVRDKRGHWVVDHEAGEEKKRNIKEAAHIYLTKKIGWTELGKQLSLPMSAGNIHRILTKDSGPVWYQFGNPIPVPPLLDSKTIEAIKAKSEDHRTWDHDTPRHKYVFNRLIRDVNPPHYALSGSTKHGIRYYKTYKGQELKYQLRADDLEQEILEHLASTLASKKAFRKAVREIDSGQKTRQEKLNREMASLEEREKRIGKQTANLIKAIKESSGFVAKKMQAEMDRLNKEHDEVQAKLKAPRAELNSMATVVDIEEARAKLKQMIRARPPLRSMGFEEQRELIKLIYGGKDHRGKKYGIYVKCLGGSPKQFKWTAYGRVAQLEGKLGEQVADIVKTSERKGRIKLRMKGKLPIASVRLMKPPGPL